MIALSLAIYAMADVAAARHDATHGRAPLRTLSETELVDMMVGAAILCTRGVNTASMIERVRDLVREGQTVRMIALEDLPDEWLGFTSFVVGGGGAWPHVTERLERQGVTPTVPAPTAAALLSAHLGAKFDAIFQAEAGGASASTLLLAAQMDIPVIDGCPSGRCLPEVQMSPFFMSGISRAPLAAVTPYGDTILVPRVLDDYRVEDITRGIVVSAGDGFLLFRGVVRVSDSTAERGFGWTVAHLDGVGDFSGSAYKIYNKNENLIGWRDGKLDAAAPDLIAALDPKTGWAMRGGTVLGSFVVGEELSIVGFPSDPLWRTPKAIGMLGPRYFGFQDDYVPIEVLHGGRHRR